MIAPERSCKPLRIAMALRHCGSWSWLPRILAAAAFTPGVFYLAGCGHRPPVPHPEESEPVNSTDSAASGLEESQRALIWRIEHQGLLLKKHGFGPLADA